MKVLITGGGSGLGRALARYYVQRGAHVVVADIRLDRAEETLASLSGSGHLAALVDVASEASWAALRTRVDQHFAGRLDVLINNAGVASAGWLPQTAPEEWDRVISINLSSVYRGTRHFTPMLLAQGRGLILNTASFAALAMAPSTGVYGVAKAGVLAFSEILRAELVHQKIHVACLCPSFFETNLLESCAPGQERMRDTAQKLMRRSVLSADDVARIAVQAAEAGQFLILPHKESRHLWRFRRWFPEWYFRKVVDYAKRLSNG